MLNERSLNLTPYPRNILNQSTPNPNTHTQHSQYNYTQQQQPAHNKSYLIQKVQALLPYLS